MKNISCLQGFLQSIPSNNACDIKLDTSKWAEIYIWHLWKLDSTDYIFNTSFLRMKFKEYVKIVLIYFKMANPSKNRSADNVIRKLIAAITNHTKVHFIDWKNSVTFHNIKPEFASNSFWNIS